MILSGLGNMPWDVLHQGLSNHLPLSLGVIAVGVSLLLLLLWIPLKQKPGLGTLSNALLVGIFIDLTIRWMPAPQGLYSEIAYMLAGVVLNGLATVLYIIPSFGPGPRDGLMTGLVRVTGKPVFAVRSAIEIIVVIIGWALGGTLFAGTFVYALGIGPVTQGMLKMATNIIPSRGPEGFTAGEDPHSTPPSPAS